MAAGIQTAGRLALILFLIAAAQAASGGDVYNGQEVYRTHCRSCHGQSGAGEVGNAPDFTIGEGLLQSDLSLMKAISDGKGVMPGYRAVLSEQEILDVISYMRALL